MDAGKRRSRLVDAFNCTLVDDFENRILDFDHESAIEAAGIAGHLQSIGKAWDACDVQIAGIVSRFHATLATRNERHFVDTGVNIVNPWGFTPG